MKEYEILGKDFVIDLCIVADVGNCYGPYGSSPKSCTTILEDLHLVAQTQVLSAEFKRRRHREAKPSTLLPNLEMHIKDITTKSVFKGQQLVDG